MSRKRKTASRDRDRVIHFTPPDNWVPVVLRKDALADRDGPHKDVLPGWCLRFPAKCWSSHARCFGDFDASDQGESARRVLGFMLSVFYNSCGLGWRDFSLGNPWLGESFQTPFEDGAIRNMGHPNGSVPEGVPRPNNMPKFRIAVEEVRSNEDVLLFVNFWFIAFDLELSFTEAVEAFLARHQGMFCELGFYQQVLKKLEEKRAASEGEDNRFAEAQQARANGALPPQPQRRPEPVIRIPKQRQTRMVIDKNQELTDSWLNVSTIGQFLEDVAIPWYFDVLGLPGDEQMLADGLGSTGIRFGPTTMKVRRGEDLNHYDGSHPMIDDSALGVPPPAPQPPANPRPSRGRRTEEVNVKAHPEYLFAGTAFLADTFGAISAEDLLHPCQYDKMNYLYRPGAIIDGKDEIWLRWPVPECVHVMNPGSFSPQAVFCTEFPWYVDVFREAITEYTELLPPSIQGIYRKARDEVIQAQRIPIRETQRRLDCDGTRLFITIVDRPHEIRRVLHTSYHCLSTLTELSYENFILSRYPGAHMEDFLVIPAVPLRELWKMHYALARSRFREMVRNRKDISVPFGGVLRMLEEDSQFERPGKVVQMDQPQFHGLDEWSVFQIHLLRGLESLEDVESKHPIVRLMLMAITTAYLPQDMGYLVYFGMHSGPALGKSYVESLGKKLLPGGSQGQMYRAQTGTSDKAYTVPVNYSGAVIFADEGDKSMSMSFSRMSHGEVGKAQAEKTAQTEGQINYESTTWLEQPDGSKRRGVEIYTIPHWVVRVSATNYDFADESIKSRWFMVTPSAMSREGRGIAERHMARMNQMVEFETRLFEKWAQTTRLMTFLIGMMVTAYALPRPNIEIPKMIGLKVLRYLKRYTPFAEFFSPRLLEQIKSMATAATLMRAAYMLYGSSRSPLLDADGQWPAFDWDHLQLAGPYLCADVALGVDVVTSMFAYSMDFALHEIIRAAAKRWTRYDPLGQDALNAWSENRHSRDAPTMQELVQGMQTAQVNNDSRLDSILKAYGEVLYVKYTDRASMSASGPAHLLNTDYVRFPEPFGPKFLALLMESNIEMQVRYDKSQLESKLFRLKDKGRMRVWSFPEVPVPEDGEIGYGLKYPTVTHYVIDKLETDKHTRPTRHTLPVFREFSYIPEHGSEVKFVGVLRQFLRCTPKQSLIDAVEECLSYRFAREHRVLLGFCVEDCPYIFEKFDVWSSDGHFSDESFDEWKKGRFCVPNPSCHPKELSEKRRDAAGLYASEGMRLPEGLETHAKIIFPENVEKTIFRWHLECCGLDPDAPECQRYYPQTIDTDPGAQPSYPESDLRSERHLQNQVSKSMDTRV